MKVRKLLLLTILVLAVPLTVSATVTTVYEIFPGSYYDSNGDGIGDLQGIRAKLDYLQSLHVDALWLTPITPSPSYHKYDTVHYTAIDPVFGTISDFDALAEDCHARGISLLFDLVINHTSTEHPWFASAVESLQNHESDNPYLSYYLFSQGSGDHPIADTDWFYAGGFGPHMPELNLDAPSVRAEIQSILAFWLSHGVDGFRLDGITHYYDAQPLSNRTFLAWVCNAIRTIAPDAFIVGEAWADEPTILDLYQSGIDALFNFPLSATGALTKAMQRQSGQAFASRIVSWQQQIVQMNPTAAAAPFLSNHDQGRIAGVLRGDLQQQKQAAAAYLLSPGIAFIYYGEELGMTGSGDDSNKRLPMLWSTANPLGMCLPPEGATQQQRLTDGADTQQSDSASLLSFYRAVLAFRQQHPVLRNGSTAIVQTGDPRLAVFTISDAQETLCIAHNFSHEDSLRLPCSGTLLAVFDTGTQQSMPYEHGMLIAPRSTAVWHLQ